MNHMSTAILDGPVESVRGIHLPPDDLAFVIPRSVRSLQGFRDWYASDDFPEEGHISYLAGEIFIDMGHERISSHVDLKGEIFHRLKSLVEELGTGQLFTDGSRVVNDTADLSSEPDCCFFTWESVRSGRVVLQRDPGGKDATEVHGSPDMVLEVVSRSSVSKDTVVLPDLYHKAEIPEFWLIDARKDTVVFQISRMGESAYELSPSKDGWHESRVFGSSFRMERFVNPIGLWQHRLLIQKPS